jgi:hypothetical protein
MQSLTVHGVGLSHFMHFGEKHDRENRVTVTGADTKSESPKHRRGRSRRDGKVRMLPLYRGLSSGGRSDGHRRLLLLRDDREHDRSILMHCLLFRRCDVTRRPWLCCKLWQGPRCRASLRPPRWAARGRHGRARVIAGDRHWDVLPRRGWRLQVRPAAARSGADSTGAARGRSATSRRSPRSL